MTARRSWGDAEISKPRTMALVAAMVATLAAAAPVAGQQPGTADAPPSDRWTITVAPYLWAAAMDGHAAVG
jgi:hypothetical protein